MNHIQKRILLAGVFAASLLCVIVPWREEPIANANLFVEWQHVRDIWIKMFPAIPEDETRRQYEDARELAIARSGLASAQDRGYRFLWTPPPAAGLARQCVIDWQRVVPPLIIVAILTGAAMAFAIQPPILPPSDAIQDISRR